MRMTICLNRIFVETTHKNMENFILFIVLVLDFGIGQLINNELQKLFFI